jgi:hypothetical protein
MAMNTGTIALNADAGRISSSAAPSTPPATDTQASEATRRR